MDNHIDPKMTAILTQLDKTKDSVIEAGRGAADDNRLSHTTINELRKENELLREHIAVVYDDRKRGNKATEVSTVSMIVSWILVAVVYVYTILGG